MKKGQTYTGIVERIDFPDKGVVKVVSVLQDGSRREERCIVKNALPGQTVTFTVNKLRKGKAEGRLVKVEQKSVWETGVSCPHFGLCGGCTYISFPYEEQLAIKEQQIRKLLNSCLEGRQKGFVFEGIKASPAVYEYRNKMEFSFGDEVKDGPLSLGMHKRGSFYDIVTVKECRIVDEDYRKLLIATLEFFQDKNISFFHRLRHVGYLRHLLVRKAVKTGEILLALVTTGQGEALSRDGSLSAIGQEEDLSRDGSLPATGQGEDLSRDGSLSATGQEEDLSRDGSLSSTGQEEDLSRDGSLSSTGQEEGLLEEWKNKLLSLKLKGKIVGIIHLINDSVADVVKSDETRILYGQDFFYEELLGLKFKISPFSFFQTNSLAAEVLYQTVREYIGNLGSKTADGRPDKIVYDLYSGTGTIAQLMAPVAGKVIGVEIIEEAVESAVKNAALNGLTNCEFIAGDVLKVLDLIEEKPDFIILDPPRDGVHPKALKKIIDYGVDRLIYISCKPTSLVRDLEMFLEKGYQVDRAVAVDQFPWTANCETVCLLSRKA